MNKFSKYNHLFSYGKQSILYNIASDGILVLQPELAALIQQNQNAIDNIEPIHPTLFQALRERNMIIEDETDEIKSQIERWKEEYDNPERCTILLLPTLDCNMRCWYCYEKHIAGSKMNEDTIQRICRFIYNKTQDVQLKELHISWFGGEPLLHFNKVVLPILQYAKSTCDQQNIKLTTHFTTNGVLLTERIRKTLLNLHLEEPPAFQITLDGNREKHNETRYMHNNTPTYDIIIENIKATIKDGMTVLNRFNYTGQNIDTLIDIPKEYDNLTEEEKMRLHFDFQQVWQESNNKESRKKALEIASIFQGSGFHISIDKKYNKQHCFEDSINHYSINYDGSVYKCTGKDIQPEIKEGILNENGEIEWNDRHYRRMKMRYGNDFCKSCLIFPICHGGCSQLALETPNNDRCLKNYTEEDKKEIIIGRLKYLLEHSDDNNN